MANPIYTFLFPRESARAMAITGIIAAGVGILTVIFGVYILRDYSVALFCGTPMVMGVAAPLFYGIGARRTFFQLFGAAVFAQCLMFAGILIFGIEGIFCILMASPLWMTIAVLGALIAYPIHRAMWRNTPEFGSRGFPVIGLLLLAALPLFMGAEHVAAPQPPLLVVTTAIEIDAPAEVVWNNVVSFPDLPAPGWFNGGWLFKAGIARPIRAEIHGTGIGATRYCVFSTGRAIEPVTAWQPARLLEIDVIQTPPSMKETSIYPNLHPAHLEGYLTSARARFELTPLPNGRTRLTGTSWYRNKMFPTAYWQLWSNAAIKAVQTSVLTHIKTLSEQQSRSAGGNP